MAPAVSRAADCRAGRSARPRGSSPRATTRRPHRAVPCPGRLPYAPPCAQPRQCAWGWTGTLVLFVRLRIAVPEAPGLERGDRPHLGVGEFETEDIEILPLPVGIAGLRDRNGTELHVPA